MGSLGIPEETLLRFIRLIKSGGLKAKPQFAVKFNKSDIPATRDRAFGAYVVPVPRTTGMTILLLSVIGAIHIVESVSLVNLWI